MSDTLLIERFLHRLRESHPDMVLVYTQGCCFELYLILKVLWPEAKPYYVFMEGHIYTKIGDLYYDIRGPHRELKHEGELFTGDPARFRKAFKWKHGAARIDEDAYDHRGQARLVNETEWAIRKSLEEQGIVWASQMYLYDPDDLIARAHSMTAWASDVTAPPDESYEDWLERKKATFKKPDFAFRKLMENQYYGTPRPSENVSDKNVGRPGAVIDAIGFGTSDAHRQSQGEIPANGNVSSEVAE